MELDEDDDDDFHADKTPDQMVCEGTSTYLDEYGFEHPPSQELWCPPGLDCECPGGSCSCMRAVGL